MGVPDAHDTVRTLLDEGYVVVRDAFEKDAVATRLVRLCGGSDYQSIADSYEDEDLALGPSRTNFRVPHRKRGELLSAPLADVLRLVDPQISWYDASIITALPGRGRQPTHRDYAMPEHADQCWKLVVFTPADDVAPRGGETVVYPRTHLGDDSHTRIKRVRLQSGDALVFFSSLRHYGAANHTDAPRIVYSQTFEARIPELLA